MSDILFLDCRKERVNGESPIYIMEVFENEERPCFKRCGAGSASFAF